MIFCAMFGVAKNSQAEELYITQNALGSDTGADCANAHAVSWFNTSGNWGTGTNKISGGDVVHFCGTITTSAVIQGSGSSGSLITLLFESGAKFSKAYWGMGSSAGIYASGKQYITIDGGTSGIIECTANGDSLANQQQASGVALSSCSNIEIKNLTIQNIYVHVYSNSSAVNSGGVFADNTSYLSIHDNTINHAYYTVMLYTSNSNIAHVNVYDNTISGSASALTFSLGNIGTAIDDLNIYNNDVTMGYNWYDPADNNHIDGIHLWGQGASNYLTNVRIYGNYFHGQSGGSHSTAMIFLEDAIINPLIYNNILVATTDSPSNGLIYIKFPSNASSPKILNNTFYGISNNDIGVSVTTDSTTTPYFVNNIFVNIDTAVYYQSSTTGAITADNNDYYGVSTMSRMGDIYYSTIANWRTYLGGCPNSGNECSSITTNPDLNNDYTEKISSPTIDAGISLSTYFTTDIVGISRPQGAAWDIGAYEYASGGVDVTAPGAPSGLAVN